MAMRLRDVHAIRDEMAEQVRARCRRLMDDWGRRRGPCGQSSCREGSLRVPAGEDARSLRQPIRPLPQAKASLAGSADSTMPMLPTFVERLPRGSESGDYFALDLGGTNLHMMYVRLTPSTGSDGIDSTADEVAIERVREPSTLRIGPTFTFPMPPIA